MRHKLFGLFCICTALAISTLLAACLDIPSTPDIQSKIEGVSVFVSQGDSEDSTRLLVRACDSSTLEARIYPATHKNDVKYFWYNDQDILDSGQTYPIPQALAQESLARELFTPNKIIIRDNNGNFIQKEFKVQFNNPPQLLEQTIPADGDTLYGTPQTPILFQWTSADRDRNQTLSHIIEIDKIQYSVGEFTEILQSGFRKGEHLFRVIVSDPFGDKDSISVRHFFVVDTLGAKS